MKQPRTLFPRFAAAAALLAAAGALMVLFGNAGGSFFPGYRAFSKGIIGALAAITGVVPFSLADWLTAALIVFAFGALIW